MTQPHAAGALVLSLDFELHWGMRDRKPATGPYRENLLGVRNAVPAILDALRRRDAHATWATVGFLFARDRTEFARLVPRITPRYVDRHLDPYGEDLGDDERADPLHFAPSLIKLVAEVPGQEIATHTHSHYYCLAPGAAADSFSADLASAQLAMATFGIPPAKSLVFPRNQRNGTWDSILQAHGIVAYRGNTQTWMHRDGDGPGLRQWHRAGRLVDTYAGSHHLVPWRDVVTPTGLCDVRASFYLRPFSTRLQRFERRKIERFKRAMRKAAEQQRIVHFWWHPHDFGKHLTRNLAMLDELLDLFVELRKRYGMQSLSMLEAAQNARAAIH